MIRWLLPIVLTMMAAKISAQIVRKPIPDKLVILTFDDAVASHFSFVAPILKKYGFGATFFVCEFPPNFGDTTKYMTWQQIRQLSEMGFEIGNHTRNHVDVDKVKEDKLNDELEYIEQKCVSLQIPIPVSFAYPGNNTHFTALSTLSNRGYLFARTGGEHAYDPAKDHPFLIPSFTVLSTNRQEIMNAFKQAKNGKIVVLTIHGVPDIAHSWVTLQPELFMEYMQYLHNEGFRVIAMKNLVEFINFDKAQKHIKPVFPTAKVERFPYLLWISGITAIGLCFYAILRSGIIRKKDF